MFRLQIRTELQLCAHQALRVVHFAHYVVNDMRMDEREFLAQFVDGLLMLDWQGILESEELLFVDIGPQRAGTGSRFARLQLHHLYLV